MSRRAQAALAAGVLAVSAAAPAAAAAEPDYRQEGAASASEGQEPNFDPGGTTTQLPTDPAQLPQVNALADPGDDDIAPLDAEPPVDTFGQEPTAGETAARPERTAARPVPSPAPTPGTNLASGPADPPNTSEKAPTAGNRTHRTKGRFKERVRELLSSLRSGDGPSPKAVALPQVVQVPVKRQLPLTEPSPTQARLVASTAISETSTVRQSGNEGLDRGDRFYVVRRGDTLWSIARDLLGPGASMARIAREVNRLWGLNRERIGTGDPDLLMIGTKLRLR